MGLGGLVVLMCGFERWLVWFGIWFVLFFGGFLCLFKLFVLFDSWRVLVGCVSVKLVFVKWVG